MSTAAIKIQLNGLKHLPRDGKKMLVKAGEENAGLMDIGNGFGVVFKIESHNHPSAIEPFQGAATGVGGIHRDIFTMGARPIAALNSLRFGNLNEAKTQHLVAVLFMALVIMVIVLVYLLLVAKYILKKDIIPIHW